jgi:hypothetical protein
MELFHKNSEELRKQLLFIASQQNVLVGLNITNKNVNDDLPSQVRIIREHFPDLSICIHLSVKYQYRRDPDQTLQRLSHVLGQLSSFPNCSILLISGSGKKRALDTVSALRRLYTLGTLPANLPIHVAYNPYSPNRLAQKEENDRLQRKLASHPGLVAGIYLQMGTDVSALRKGLDFIDGAVAETRNRIEDQCYRPQLYGSVFLPSRQLLAQMKFRPWNGVFLSPEYLANVDTADKISVNILSVYMSRGVMPVVESAVRTEEQLARLEGLLAMAQKRSLHQ